MNRPAPPELVVPAAGGHARTGWHRPRRARQIPERRCRRSGWSPDCSVTIGVVEGVPELAAQDRRDGVVLLGPAKHEVADGIIVFDVDGITHRQFLSNDGPRRDDRGTVGPPLVAGDY
jgi:hypothetical protein